MVDREAKRAEGKGIGYDRWASMQRNYQMSMPQPKRGHSHEQER